VSATLQACSSSTSSFSRREYADTMRFHNRFPGRSRPVGVGATYIRYTPTWSYSVTATRAQGSIGLETRARPEALYVSAAGHGGMRVIPHPSRAGAHLSTSACRFAVLPPVGLTTCTPGPHLDVLTAQPQQIELVVAAERVDVTTVGANTGYRTPSVRHSHCPPAKHRVTSRRRDQSRGNAPRRVEVDHTITRPRVTRPARRFSCHLTVPARAAWGGRTRGCRPSIPSWSAPAGSRRPAPAGVGGQVILRHVVHSQT